MVTRGASGPGAQASGLRAQVSGLRLATVIALTLVFPSVGPAQTRITLEQAGPVLRALEASLPAPLRNRTAEQLAALWPSWVETHDRDVRARLARGDEDSVVNFWLYGTSFTSAPPAIARGALIPPAALEALAQRRLDDLLERLAAPGDNERLRFARQVLAARDAEASTAAGRARARRVLADARQRMIREFAAADRALAGALAGDAGARTGTSATVFRERGLSSDTSVLSDYGVRVALEAIHRQGTLAPGSVRHVAIIGPGLDFTNKTDGHDFYPQQTIQPFAVADALRRTGLAAADLRLTTFDISARVNAHLTNGAAGAGSAQEYVVTLPLDAGETWTNELVAYWQRWGSEVGDEVPAARPPASAGPVRVRAVRIRPDLVRSITPRDMNIVVDRLALPDAERFDLVVATNVLLYYDVFEQALAVSNIAAMLRPGGVFVTNTAVFPTPPLQASASYLRVAHTTLQYDEMLWYRR